MLCAPAFHVGFAARVRSRRRSAAANRPHRTAQLDALSGEYTNPDDPDTPLSFYVQNGKLIVESERQVPTELDRHLRHRSLPFPTRRRSRSASRSMPGRGASGRLCPTSPTPSTTAPATPVHHVFHDYQRTEVMIPMRDGIKLHAVILKPADIATPLPFLIQRTPYGVDGTSRAAFFGGRPELARDGYIYVGEDIRGRYKSEGKFVMSRPLADHSNPKAVDESTDAYDTVAWLLKNVPGNNGRAGFVGTSYPGFLAMMAGIDPHPAVKAISPQAPMIDVWMGDDFFHNGAFRQSYGYDYVLWHGVEQGEHRGQLRQGQGRQARGWLRLLPGARSFRRGRETVRLQGAAHLEALPRSSRLTTRCGRRAASRTISTPSPCRR